MAKRFPIGRMRSLPDDISPKDKAVLAWANAWVYLRYPRTVLKHRDRVGSWPNIAFPGNPNEGLFWRKIFDHNPAFPKYCDKLQTKTFYMDKCPGISVPETLWVGERAEDIPDELLKRSVIVKTIGASAQNILVRDGKHDRRLLNKTVNAWLAGPNYGKRKGEWAYSQVAPKLMVEELILDEKGALPINAKVFVAGGKPIFVWICRFQHDTDTLNAPKQAGTFALDGTRIHAQDAAYSHPDQNMPDDYIMPASVFKAFEYAAAAGKEFDYVRLDFLCGQESVHAGEVTLYTGAGFDTWNNHDIPRLIMDCWDLRQTWFLRTKHSGWRSAYAESLSSVLDCFYSRANRA